MSAAQDTLRRLGACADSIAWLGKRPLADAWATCHRGDWLLWLAARAGVDHRLVVSAACACARPTLVHVPAGEHRPRRAIEMAERWSRGEATIDEVRSAASAAYAAASAAYAAAKADAAAYAAAYAADAAAYAAAYAASTAVAAYAAYAAAYAAFAAGADAADAASLRASADLVRATIPWSAVEAALEVQS